MRKCSEILLRLIAIIGLLIFIVLTLYSWRYTMEVSFHSEELTDSRDTIWRSVLLLLLSAEIVFRLKTWEKCLTEKRVHILTIVMALAAIVMGFVLIRSTHSETGTDQLHVYMVAEDIANGSGERFISGDDYFYCSPHQLGLAGVYALLMKITGVYSGDLLRGFHALCMGVIVYVGFLITRQLSDDRRAEIIYLLGICSFLPLYLYVLFVYGEIIGTCGVFCAVWAFLKINREQTPAGADGIKKVWRYWLILAISMAFMYVARKGLLVVWIAMFIIQGLLMLQKKGKLALLVLIGVLVLTLGSQSMLIHISEKRMGADFGRGLSMMSWLAMES
mgnify:CR=1 FL=1